MKWQPTPVFLPGESCGWRTLVGCRLWGCTELDTTEATYHACIALETINCSFEPIIEITELDLYRKKKKDCNLNTNTWLPFKFHFSDTL